MGLSLQKYFPYLDGLDMSAAEKEDIIRTVWGLMESQVDQAFGRHPVQAIRGYISNDNLQSPTTGIDSNNVIPLRVSGTFNAQNPPKKKVAGGHGTP
jgi:hypothetical protein